MNAGSADPCSIGLSTRSRTDTDGGTESGMGPTRDAFLALITASPQLNEGKVPGANGLSDTSICTRLPNLEKSGIEPLNRFDGRDNIVSDCGQLDEIVPLIRVKLME